MRVEAISLRRISDRKQAEGHSLVAQADSTVKMAEQLDVPIVKSWDMIQTSKKGKNFGRTDMEEMLRYCKQNSQVKYLLIDFVNRLMREVEVIIYYKVLFNQIGVELVFCDPAQHHLNSNDQYSKLMLYIEGYKAEQDNASRGETTIARMRARYEAGYYISHPHAGYMKSNIKGIHAKDPERFELIQKGSRLIIYEQCTPEQAVKWMNDNGYKTRGSKKMDVSHYIEFIVDRYFCGIIDIKKEGPLSDVKDAKGLHEPMFTVREHERLVAVITKRNPRVRLKHNPEYPVANLIRHYECKHEKLHSKFSGFPKDRGYRNGKKRPMKPTYRCRTCRREFSRQKLHDGIDSHLKSLEFIPDDTSFKRALLKVWRSQRGSVIQRINALEANKVRVEADILKTAADYGKEPEGAAKNALRRLLEDYEKQLEAIKKDIMSTQNIDMESEDFVKFAMNFTEKLKDKWWSISFNERKGGEQILFNGEFYVDTSAKVHTPKLSSIYTLGTNKNGPGGPNFTNLVELPGTAPGSVGRCVVRRLQV